MISYSTRSLLINISRKHSHILEHESGIDPGIIQERGYRTVRSRAELEEFPDWQRRLGLYIPMFSPDGITRSAQIRPNKPIRRKNGDTPKYETPQGSGIIIDAHPRMMEEVRAGDGDLWVTEGVKKADSLASRGAPAVALAGVWMAHVPKSKPKRLLPCWDHVRLEGRRVYVAFDSDAMEKEEVQGALEWLIEALEERGADVLVVYLPAGENGEKVGVDDFLAAGGTVAELQALSRRFEPEDLGRIRLSRDEKLRAAVEDLERRFWAEEWKGMGGHTDRDLALMLVEAARRHGKVVKGEAGGIRVVKSWGALMLEAKVSRRTLWKSLGRLEERGFCRRDYEGRKADKAGAFVLRASVNHYGGRAAGERKATRELQGYGPGGLHLRAAIHAAQERGDELGESVRVLPMPDRSPGGLRLRAPRLRWSAPARKPRLGTVRGTRKVRQGVRVKARPAVKRLGKTRGAIIDVVEACGGQATLGEMAASLHKKRPRDLRRRSLPMLEEAGILTVEDDLVTLADNWLEALERARELGGEIASDEAAAEDLKLRRRAYHNRHKVTPDPHWANDPDADGAIEDLRPAHEGSEAVGPEPRKPEQDAAAAVVLGYVERLGKIRLGLLEQIWLEDHGGDLAELRGAIDAAGVQRERLREFRNAEFLFPPAERVA